MLIQSNDKAKMIYTEGNFSSEWLEILIHFVYTMYTYIIPYVLLLKLYSFLSNLSALYMKFILLVFFIAYCEKLIGKWNVMQDENKFSTLRHLTKYWSWFVTFEVAIFRVKSSLRTRYSSLFDRRFATVYRGAY
jgi:hypothetical protein